MSHICTNSRYACNFVISSVLIAIQKGLLNSNLNKCLQKATEIDSDDITNALHI
jgi:hypothetical protein